MDIITSSNSATAVVLLTCLELNATLMAPLDEVCGDQEANLLGDVARSPVPGSVAARKSTASPQFDRYGFAVIDEPWDDEGQLRPAGVWHLEPFGARAGAAKRAGPTWVCAPLYVRAITTDGRGGSFGRLLRFKDSLGRWRDWPMPMEMLASDGAEMRRVLLSMGLTIAPSGRGLLSTYLQSQAPEQQVLCVAQTGWVDSGQRMFVLPDEVFGATSNEVAYQILDRPPDAYSCAGSLAGWQEALAARARGNPLLMMAISLAFTGPLLAMCNGESGGIHLNGPSSAGKSSILEAACSVWGGAGYRRSWRATSNGMEGAAALSNDSLLALDEISECDPREVGAIVYSLGNGLGKQRAGRSGVARPVARWRCGVISSGERTIGTAMAEGGRRIKAGQTVRLLDIPVQRRFGAWDDLHGLSSGSEFSDTLKRAAVEHHGHAGRAFLRALTGDGMVDVPALWEQAKGLPEFACADGDGQATRAAARLALVAVAGELACRYGVTGWTPGEATAAAADAFAAWLAQRGPLQGGLEHQQVASRLLEFISRHGESRFSALYPSQGLDRVVHNRVGWWREVAGKRTYLFTPAGLQDALEGFDKALIFRVLEEVGAVPARGTDGKLARLFKVDGHSQRLYEVDPARLEAASDCIS